MSNLIIYKSNDLAISRYDLTDQETKLLSLCIAKLNPSIENPSEENRTIKINYIDYANYMGIDPNLAWKNLHASTKNIMSKVIEMNDEEGRKIFQWANFAKFDDAELTLIFSKEIQPFLFKLKHFIKYNLNYIKKFKNKYSTRIYEFLLKEINGNMKMPVSVRIEIKDLLFFLMLEKKIIYKDFKYLKQRILNVVIKEINCNTDIHVTLKSEGRPVSAVIFECVLDRNRKDKKMDKEDKDLDGLCYKQIEQTLRQDEEELINISRYEKNFLENMKTKYESSLSFQFLTDKQKIKIEQILKKYGNS